MSNNMVSAVDSKLQDKHERQELDKYFDYECFEDPTCKKEWMKEVAKESGKYIVENHVKLPADLSTIVAMTGIVFVLFMIFVFKKPRD